jgi:deoxyribonuclease-2
METKLTLLIIISSLFLMKCATDKVCRNPSGTEVDWYVIFFMPQTASSDNKIHYGYFDNTQKSLNYYLYEESTFPPTRITSYVTSNPSATDFNYFFWNDDLTTKDGSSKSASSERAHAKGSLVYDKNNGVFLLHSLPRFPTRTSDNEILTELPSNGGVYGQHFLCITVSKTTAEKIAELLNYINISNNASVKKDNVNSSANKWITALINNKYDSSYPKELQTTIKSKNGVDFNFISKSYLNKITPYDTTVRSIYSDDFYVRTWTKPSLAPAICEEYSLFNVENVQFGEYGYAKGKEHSKWAISVFKYITCFGDLNHCESQSNRGGNIVCFENEKLHNIMKNAVNGIDSCPA